MALGQSMEQGKMQFKFQAANYLSSCIQGAHNSTPQDVHLASEPKPPFERGAGDGIDQCNRTP